MARAYLGTRHGVFRLDGDELKPLGLIGHRIWAIHAWEDDAGNDIVLAGTYGEGIFRSADGGETWDSVGEGISAVHLRTIQPGPAGSSEIFAGSEPARAFRSTDRGRNWTEFQSIEAIDGCADWFLPYSPRAGALRNFAFSPDGEIYASVEVGGLLQSTDGGDSWRLIQVDPGPRIHDDIHFVIVDPRKASRLFVAMGGALVDRTHGQWSTSPRQIGGVAGSEDGGQTWEKIEQDYTRAIHIPDRDPDWLIAAPAERTDHGGWIVGSLDRGETWMRIDSGIDTPMDDMVERFEESPDGKVWAVCSGGRAFVAEPGEWQWSSLLSPDSSPLVVESIAFAGTYVPDCDLS